MNKKINVVDSAIEILTLMKDGAIRFGGWDSISFDTSNDIDLYVGNNDNVRFVKGNIIINVCTVFDNTQMFSVDISNSYDRKISREVVCLREMLPRVIAAAVEYEWKLAQINEEEKSILSRGIH